MRRYLLWDHDGVLVDTERCYFEATRKTLEQLGVRLTQSMYLDYMARGQSCWDLARAAGVPADEVSRQKTGRDELYQDYLRTKPIEIEGVRDVLAELAASYRMAVVTTARRADFDIIHRSRDLLRFFEFVLTIEDYARPKPEGDPYLTALTCFGSKPGEAIVIEDSARGLESARRAGLDCLVVRNSFTATQDFSAAWKVLDSIRAVPRALAGRH